MKTHKIEGRFSKIFDLAVQLTNSAEADSMLVLLEGPTDWKELQKRAGKLKILVAADKAEQVTGPPRLVCRPCSWTCLIIPFTTS